MITWNSVVGTGNGQTVDAEVHLEVSPTIY